ncbi:hypothetical protein [Caballeronia sp. LZ034LL]|uniref:hypothetical protein n=1 Tax=Caballeronia sp. LZ034LL TaxID=3038567 RepID=UPI0028650EC9|nr:hypothetical protein [Caballeronia sp. LZ034LL]MDR5836842.1 hypothetical protein [Caballeronia sp. LZ034LL]
MQNRSASLSAGTHDGATRSFSLDAGFVPSTDGISNTKCKMPSRMQSAKRKMQARAPLLKLFGAPASLVRFFDRRREKCYYDTASREAGITRTAKANRNRIAAALSRVRSNVRASVISRTTSSPQ